MKNSIVTFFLGPFSYVWKSVYRLRRLGYKIDLFSSNSFRVPIISVGNLSFGGTGKTPLTIWLANYFSHQKLSPLILMRGYRGKMEKKGGIIKSGEFTNVDSKDFGDEAVLISRKASKANIIVGKNRSQNLAFYYEQVSPDVILLDDGHQHLKIKRDLNLILFDATMDLKKYKVAPLGYLREGLSSLRDADVVLIGKCDQVPPSTISALEDLITPYLNTGVVVAKTGLVPTGIYNSAFEKVMGTSDLEGKNVILLSGIASPYSFFSLVESLGANVVKRVSYPDHYYFKEKEIKALLKEADSKDSIILTTEKDFMRLRDVTDDLAIYFLGIDINFLSGENEFKKIIQKIL
ncbi:MAG: tetraacyldisaccharide 4'-kinase [Epsilonproteobacteria bacterium]|nr:MAG: tetraacyldisaccharide 4'-kinase [Campylobacterota bacterium]RLA66713.1 MAG: tetraacyldisaccharide 4'-kinase [Campylobacterota bacterium]